MLFLKLEIIKKVMGVIMLAVTLPFGLFWMAAGRVLSSIVSTVINAFPNKKLLQYSYFDQINDILPSVVLSIFMSVVVFFIGKLSLLVIVVFFIQLCTGVLLYILLAKLSGIKVYNYFIQTLKGLKK